MLETLKTAERLISYFPFLFWQNCRLEVLKWEWKLLLNGSHVFQLNSSQCQRQGTQGTVYMFICLTDIHVRQLRDLNHFQMIGQGKLRKSK